MGGSDEIIKSARKNVQDAIERQEAERRRKLLQHRIDLARSGVRAYQDHKLADAVKAFHTYLRILEDWKGVPEGSLTPAHFDVKKDIQELLLISGVYWDLVKVYDRAKSVEKARDFQHYMEKFILFSRGMPYQVLTAETMRKYIVTDKPVHKDAFRTGYRALTGSNPDCFVATAVGDLVARDTIQALRAFRDGALSRSVAGRAFTRWYYRRGPRLAARVALWPLGARRALAAALDFAAEHIKMSVQDRADALGAEDELAVRQTDPDR